MLVSGSDRGPRNFRRVRQNRAIAQAQRAIEVEDEKPPRSRAGGLRDGAEDAVDERCRLFRGEHGRELDGFPRSPPRSAPRGCVAAPRWRRAGSRDRRPACGRGSSRPRAGRARRRSRLCGRSRRARSAPRRASWRPAAAERRPGESPRRAPPARAPVAHRRRRAYRARACAPWCVPPRPYSFTRPR